MLNAVTHLPVIVDPSHAAGVREIVPVLARASAAIGADGLLVEVHPRPESALSDGDQSLTLAGFRRLDARSRSIPCAASSDCGRRYASDRRRRLGAVEVCVIRRSTFGILPDCRLRCAGGARSNSRKDRWPSAPASAENGIGVPVIYTAAKQYLPLSWLHGGERFPQGATLMIHDSNGDRVLSDKFVRIRRRECFVRWKVSTFFGKATAGDAWQAWSSTSEMARDATNKGQ